MEKKYELELKRIFFFLVYKKKKKIFSNIRFPNFEGKTVVRFIYFRRLFSTRTGRKTVEISTPETQRLQNKATMWGPNFEEIMIIIILINISVRLFVSSRKSRQRGDRDCRQDVTVSGELLAAGGGGILGTFRV